MYQIPVAWNDCAPPMAIMSAAAQLILQLIRICILQVMAAYVMKMDIIELPVV